MVNRGIKIALPGYNALEDTNPDHFALYVDQGETDYILIKEKKVGTKIVGASSYENIIHGLDYVPLCYVFAEISSGVWSRIYARSIDSNGLYFDVNSANLILTNTTGSSVNFSYHIFYDSVDGSPNLDLDIGKHLVFAVAKKGINVLATRNPNDFIFHSDYNTFKIIKEETKQITLLASTSNQVFTEAHLQKFTPFVNGFALEVGRDQVFLPNSDNIAAWDINGWLGTGVTFNSIKADGSDIIFNFSNGSGSAKTINIRYFILEKII